VARVAELRVPLGRRVIAANKAAQGLVADATELSESEQAKAHNALSDAVLAGAVRHGNEPALNTAVRAARWKPSGNTRVLDQKGATDISPLTAAAWRDARLDCSYDRRMDGGRLVTCRSRPADPSLG
jgi:hypothetical protein